MTRDQILYRLDCGRWERIDTSVLRVAGTPGGRPQQLMAACLAGPAVVSHRSAANLWHLPDLGEDLLEVTAWRHRRRRSRDVVWHESSHLGAIDVTSIDGLPVTRPTRTLIDLAGVVRGAQLERAVDDALRRRLTTVEEIGRRLEALGTLRRGHARMRTLLLDGCELLGATESTLETRFLQLVRSVGLPLPALQHAITRPDGQAARIDCAYPDRRIAIELDSARFHTGRVDHQHDVARQNDLVLAGWHVLRYTWHDVVECPDRVASQVRHAIDASRRRNSSDL